MCCSPSPFGTPTCHNWPSVPPVWPLAASHPTHCVPAWENAFQAAIIRNVVIRYTAVKKLHCTARRELVWYNMPMRR